MYQNQRAFTLMELLLVISIMMAILFMPFYFFKGMRQRNALEQDVASLTALARNARLLSVVSKNATQFGIHLTSSEATLFEGSTYVAGGVNERKVTFSDEVYMSGYSLNQGSPDILFSRLTGNTQNYGTITLSLKDNSTSTTITILPTGVVQ